MHATTSSWIPALALLPAAAQLALAIRARLGPERQIADAAVRASWVSVPVSVALGAAVATRGGLSTPLLGTHGLGFSLRADALNVVLFGMVALLGIVLVRFSRTYLEGDARRGVFLGRLCATLAAVQLLLVAGNLALFFVAWVATSLALHGLLLFYPERPRAWIAAHKKFVVARIGDAALLGAFSLLYLRFGTGELEGVLMGASERLSAAGLAPGGTVGGEPLVLAAGFLIVIAALFKSAQFPTHGWLVEVMETPTPVSALLHAGVLNAGPFLVLRFAGVMELAPAATLLLLVVGGFTALFASLVLMTQPSVKVGLGYSSAAHMGFTLFVCGLGVYAAAFLHLVGHSFYKAHAFLSSGSVVDVARSRHVPVAARLRSPARLASSFAAALGIYLGVAWLVGIQPAERPELIAVGAVIVLGLTQLLAPAIDSTGSWAGTLRTMAMAGVVALSFFALESGAHHVVEAALPAPDQPNPVTIAFALLVLTAFAVATAVQLALPSLDAPRTRAAYVHLRNGLYANAAFDRLVGALRRA